MMGVGPAGMTLESHLEEDANTAATTPVSIVKRRHTGLPRLCWNDWSAAARSHTTTSQGRAGLAVCAELTLFSVVSVLPRLAPGPRGDDVVT